MAPPDKKDPKAKEKDAKAKDSAPPPKDDKPKEDKPKEGGGKAKPKDINQETGKMFENCMPKNPGPGCYLLYVLPFFIGLAPYLLTRKPAKPKCSRSPPRPPCC